MTSIFLVCLSWQAPSAPTGMGLTATGLEKEFRPTFFSFFCCQLISFYFGFRKNLFLPLIWFCSCFCSTMICSKALSGRSVSCDRSSGIDLDWAHKLRTYGIFTSDFPINKTGTVSFCCLHLLYLGRKTVKGFFAAWTKLECFFRAQHCSWWFTATDVL